jgi:hypothetical protein
MLNVQSKPWFRPGLPKGAKKHVGCLCCGGSVDNLSMKTRLYNGFGGWTVFKDDTIVSNMDNVGYDEAPTLLRFENMARKEPESEWRAELYLPLRGATYQRHGYNMWVLIETNPGFA